MTHGFPPSRVGFPGEPAWPLAREPESSRRYETASLLWELVAGAAVPCAAAVVGLASSASRVDRPDTAGQPRASVKKSSSILKLRRKLLRTSQDVQIMDDRATAQIEEILAHPTIACASSLPVADMGERMLYSHPFAQFVTSLRRLLTLA